MSQLLHFKARSVAEQPAEALERPVLLNRDMVRLTVTLRPTARCLNDLVEAFRYLLVSTKLEPGCLGCSVWSEPDATVHYIEEWQTEADIRRRVGSDRFTSVLALIESVPQVPQVHFDFVSETRGLDYIEEVRHGAS